MPEREDGKVKWDVVIADSARVWSTNAPLVVKNHVLVGVSGDFDNAGTAEVHRCDTGKTQWIFYSTPPLDRRSGQRGATGGQMWTLAPTIRLNLVYVGTGNPTPVLNGTPRPGDNRWTCSIVALNPDRKLGLGLPGFPHDGMTGTRRSSVLVDADFGGQPQAGDAGIPKRLLLRARRTNGKNL